MENQYLKNVDAPVYLFHGDKDEVIPVESSVMLSEEFNLPFTKLEKQGHMNIAGNTVALQELELILK